MDREKVGYWLDEARLKAYRLLINRYTQEQFISPSFIHVTVGLYFVIVYLVFMGFNKEITEVGQKIETLRLVVLTFGSCWLTTQLTIFGSILCLAHSRTPLVRLMYRISIYMTIAFT